jgi:hypothetical protein
MRDDLYQLEQQLLSEAAHDDNPARKLSKELVLSNGQDAGAGSGHNSLVVRNRIVSMQHRNRTRSRSESMNQQYQPNAEGGSFPIPHTTSTATPNLDSANFEKISRQMRDAEQLISGNNAAALVSLQSKIQANQANSNGPAGVSHDQTTNPDPELMIAALGLDHRSPATNAGGEAPTHLPPPPPIPSNPPPMEPRASESVRPERRGSWQLPKFKASSFLASNRLSSTGTSGVLQQQQSPHNGTRSHAPSNASMSSSSHGDSAPHTPSNHQLGNFSNSMNNLSSQNQGNQGSGMKKILSIGASLASIGEHPHPPSIANVSQNEESNGSGKGRSPDASTPGNTPSTTSAVLSSAQRLLAEGVISQKEYDQLIHSDAQYREENKRDEAFITYE